MGFLTHRLNRWFDLSLTTPKVIEAGAFLLMVVLGVQARAFAAYGLPLWYDEAGTLFFINAHFDQFMRAVVGDVHPPLYFVIAWVQWWVNPDILGLQMLSAGAFVFCVLFADELGQAVGLTNGQRIALAALVCFLPFQIYYGSDARPYMLLQMFYLMATVGIVRQRYWLLGLSVWGLLLTANYGVLYVGTLLLVDARQWRRWAWPVGLALALYLPWLPFAMQQAAQVGAGYWLTFSYAQDIPTTLFTLFGYGLPDALAPSAFVVIISIIGGVLFYQTRAKSQPLALALFFIPCVMAALISLWKPIWLTRALIGVSVPLYIVIVDAVWKLPRYGRTALITIAATLLAFAPLAARYARVVKAERWAQTPIAALPVAAGDVVYHINTATYVEAQQHPQHHAQHYLIPQVATAGIGSNLSPISRAALNIRELPLASIHWQRAWLIVPHDPDNEAQAQTLLSQHTHRLVANYPDPAGIGGVAVYLLWPPSLRSSAD